jgi:hypothetical protein
VADNRITTSNKGIAFIFPLWLIPTGAETNARPNIAPSFARAIVDAIGLRWRDAAEEVSGRNGGKAPGHWDGRGDSIQEFGPRDLFDWIYAVLHSPAYRIRYAKSLKSGFPRIPLPGSVALFRAQVPLGAQLVALHLLDTHAAATLTEPREPRFAGRGPATVAKGYPKYADGRVHISPDRWFEPVPSAVWEFHIGGYQVCQKWLKDRRGRTLSPEDQLHYRRIVVALGETIRLMAEVDRVVEAHGGWPSAFRGMPKGQGGSDTP